MRLGGTLPLLADLAERGIPSIVSGFALPDDAFHAPNESYRLESLRLGEAAARELYAALAELPPSADGSRWIATPRRAGSIVLRTCQRPRVHARGSPPPGAGPGRRSGCGRAGSTSRGSSSSSWSTLRGS